jgi:hypothetical protein
MGWKVPCEMSLRFCQPIRVGARKGRIGSDGANPARSMDASNKIQGFHTLDLFFFRMPSNSLSLASAQTGIIAPKAAKQHVADSGAAQRALLP